MFCPNCGNKIENQQSFCRVCGLELGKSLDILSKNASISIEKTDWVKRVGLFSIGIVGGVTLAAFLIFLFARVLRFSEDFGLGFFIFLSIVLLGIISVMFFEKYGSKKPPKSELDENYKFLPPNQVELWRTNRQLKEPTFEPIPIVTEQTTQLFYAERIKQKISGDLG